MLFSSYVSFYEDFRDTFCVFVEIYNHVREVVDFIVSNSSEELFFSSSPFSSPRLSFPAFFSSGFHFNSDDTRMRPRIFLIIPVTALYFLLQPHEQSLTFVYPHSPSKLK